MVHALQKFRNYEVAEREDGGPLELARNKEEVACLVAQPEARRFAELRVVAGVDAYQPEAAAQVSAFQAAVKAWAEVVSDPHVVRVWEAGIDEGALFYVTEFVDGEELGSYLERCHPLPPWLALELARQLTAGVRAIQPWPALLDKVVLERARVAQEGETTDELRLRLTDLGLSRQKGEYVALSDAEGRVVRGLASLLARALGASWDRRQQAEELARLPVPPALVRFLTPWLDPHQRFGVGALDKWQQQLEACLRDRTLSRRPERLPHGFRVQLPLTAHFPPAEELAAEAGPELQVEDGWFEAALPYARRARWRGRTVVLHWLPPERLMSPVFKTPLLLALERTAEEKCSPLLRVLAVGPGDAPRWFVEEAPPRLNLDVVRRLRGQLTAREAVLLLQAVDSTVQWAEERGLTPVMLDPQQIFLLFDGETPGDDELSAFPVEQWPSFCCQLRAHPIPLHTFQPIRLSRSRLAGVGEPRHAAVAGGAPTAADYAALLLWLCGGAKALPESVATTVTRTLGGSGEPDRRKFMALLRPLASAPPPAPAAALETKPSAPAAKPAASPEAIPPPEKPIAAAAKPSAHVTPPAQEVPHKEEGHSAARVKQEKTSSPKRGRRRRKKRRRGNGAVPVTVVTEPAAPAAKAPASAAPSLQPVDDASENFPIPAQAASRAGTDTDEEEERDWGGFAEVLMGGLAAKDRDGDGREGESEEDESPPVGALFGSTVGPSEDSEAGDNEDEQVLLNFQPYEERRGLRVLWMVLLVVGLALLIAVIMAEVTGLAPWRQGPLP